jgi:hypothetical protein
VPRHLLTAKQIVAASDCDLVDGDGLIVRVNGPSVTAVLRFTSPVTGSRREMGLGGLRRDSLAAVGEGLATARMLAEDARRLIQQKKDPIEEREREVREDASVQSGIRNAQRVGNRMTLRRYARTYHEKHVEPVRTAKHAQQWLRHLRFGGDCHLGERPGVRLAVLTARRQRHPRAAAGQRERLPGPAHANRPPHPATPFLSCTGQI